MAISKSSAENPVRLDDFCRLCLLQKPDLRPLSSQIQNQLTIPEMLHKVIGALPSMHDQLPRVICERCLIKLELAYNVFEEFRKQEELLQKFLSKGVLVDQLIEYQQSEESRRKPYSEEVIERLTVVDNTVQKLADLAQSVGIKQEVTPFEDHLDIVKPEPFEATEFSLQMLPEDSIGEGVEQPEWKQQPNEILDNGHKMVLELEDLRTIGALPEQEQLDTQQIPENSMEKILTGGFVVSYLAESEEEQSKGENNTDYVPYDENQGGQASFAGSESEKEEGQFRCEICNKPYDTQDEVDEHRLSRHKGSTKPWRFECIYCQQRFNQKIEKQRHEKSHENRLAEGAPEPNQGPHKCPVCYRRYHSLHTFNYHLQRHQNITEGKFRCKVCDHAFGSMTELRRHEKLHEQNSELRMTRDNIPPPILVKKDDKTAYKCTECPHISVSHFKYVQHIKRHNIRKTGKFQCQDCGNRYAIKKFLLHHQRKVHSLLIKLEPDDKETNPSNKPVEIDKRLSHCSECDAFFLSKADYKIHVSVHEPGSNQKTSVSVKSEPADEDCQQLEGATPKESLSTSIDLNESMTPGSVWKCDECGESVKLRAEGTYRDHKRKHERIRNVTQKCEICKIAFSTWTELRRHREVNHGFVGQKRGVTEECPQCKKQVKKDNLQKHIKTHENLNLRKYVCEKCGTALGTQPHLKLHVESGICEKPGYVPRTAEALSMEGLQEFFTWEDDQTTMLDLQAGKFKCKQCGILLKGYRSAAKHAKRHGILNAGIYTCEICEKVFSAKSDLDRHTARYTLLGKICRKPKKLSVQISVE